MLKRRIVQIVLIGLMLFLALIPIGPPYTADSVDGIASRHTFSIPLWELKKLLRIGPSLDPIRHEQPSDEREMGMVRASFKSNRPSDSNSRAEVSNVRSIIKRQVTQVLEDEGITLNLGPFTRVLFPPVDFELIEMPLLLIVSPREKIALMKTVLLVPSLDEKQVTTMESRVEKLGLSALVERIGGISLYPSLVPMDGSLRSTLDVIAHEWTHQYLFFTPLGRSYWSNYDMTTANETVADIVGNEVGRLVYERYYKGEEEISSRPESNNASPSKRPAFNFNEEMKTTRRKVDSLLAQGHLDEAERYMEDRRQFLAQNGYHIRKLNQAYFAFHGSYASAPGSGSVSPIGPGLLNFRRQSRSLGEFVRQVSQVANADELARLISRE